MMRDGEFSDVVADALREVGNIGAGHAANALSVLLQQQVQMEVPSARMVPFPEVADIVGGADQVVAAVYTQIDGPLNGQLLLVLPGDSASRLVSRLLLDNKEIAGFTEFELSTLAEVGNILGGSFINAIGDLTGLRAHLSVPAVTVDMAAAVLDICMLTAAVDARETLMIDANISQGAIDVQAHIVLVPNPETMPSLLAALGC